MAGVTAKAAGTKGRSKTAGRRVAGSTKDTQESVVELAQIFAPVLPHLLEVERQLVHQVEGFDPGIQEYIRYALDGQGKRLRPVLALLTGGACGGIKQGHIDLGVVVELIHLATLVHDDVIDEAVVRHRKPSSNARWGNETSVLVGDCLFAHALELAARYPTTTVCRKVSAATNTVCAGEILQTRERFNLDLTLKQYLQIVEMKTAALFAVSCELGAYLSGAGEKQMQALRSYGLALGTAYQIYDDCVDIFGEEPKAGKSLGTDLDTGKLTLPLLLFLQQAEADEKARVRALLLENGLASRKPLAELLSKHEALRGSLDLIKSYTQQALDALGTIHASPFRESLRQLVDFLYEQTCKLTCGK